MTIKTKQQAPNFKLYNTEKKEVELDSLKGQNVVLLFFPLAFTGTCTAELCSVRDNLATYNSLNAIVFGISVDSPHTLLKFKTDQNLNFELLSDFNKTVSPLYGSMYDEFVLGMKGVSKRAAFVIDKNGLVEYAEVLEKAGDLPNFEAINNTLKSLN